MKKIWFEFVQGHRCIISCPYGMDCNVGSNSCQNCKYHIKTGFIPRKIQNHNNCYVECIYENKTKQTFFKLYLSEKIDCIKCNGSGSIKGTDGPDECAWCEGAGKIKWVYQAQINEINEKIIKLTNTLKNIFDNIIQIDIMSIGIEK